MVTGPLVVLAGTFTALGIVSAVRAFGLVPLLAIYGGLWLFAVFVVRGLCDEAGIPCSSVPRISLLATIVVLVVAGLCELHPEYGLLTAALIGLTSPAALDVMGRLVPRPTRRAAEQEAPGVLLDPVKLDRRFPSMQALGHYSPRRTGRQA